MEKIKDDEKLNYYILRYNINEMFSTDMRPYMKLVLFNKNEHICKSGERINHLFFFVDGKAKVYTLLSNGKALLLCFYRPFMTIGDVEFMHCKFADSNIQVIENTYCVAIQFKDIRKYAINDAKFLRAMCDSLGKKLTNLAKYSSINLLYPLENRLSSYILAVSSNDINKHKNSIVFDGNLTEVSELLGASYRHLLRNLNKLCDKGAIRKNNNYYEILNISILEELAGELYE